MAGHASIVRRRRAASGCALAFAVFAACMGLFFEAVPLWPAGIAIWLAALALWPDTRVAVRRQALALVGVGLLGYGAAFASGSVVTAERALYANVPLIAMLAGVSFLRLVAAPAAAAGTHAVSGRRALAGTLAGLHLSGAVVNLSALVIVSQPMALDGRLDSRQVRVLSRGFATAALWSPFFAAMAAALTFAPGAHLATLVAAGAPLALVGLLLTYREVARELVDGFRGYPLRPGTLALPLCLAVIIMLVHGAAPGLPVLGLVAISSPLVTAVALLCRRSSLWRNLVAHTLRGLPLMRNELTLFLAAGVLAGGINAALPEGGGWLPFAHFAAPQASIALVAIVALAVIGVHPIISIAVLGTAVEPLAPDANLLAMTFLAGWSIGVAVSPLSGINLTLQGMYGFPGRRILRWNSGYAAVMLVAAVLVLSGYSALGIL